VYYRNWGKQEHKEREDKAVRDDYALLTLITSSNVINVVAEIAAVLDNYPPCDVIHMKTLE